jgi:hypothetical protein
MSIEFCIAATRVQEPLHCRTFHEWAANGGAPWLSFYRQDAGYLLRFTGLADFEVSADGHSVRCWPAPDVSDETIRHLQLNQVLPLALSLQGRFVLHASAVELPSGAVAFIGLSGRGKSTLAASFAANGSRFLADDGLVIETRDGECIAMPSHPSIRLWEDSREALLAENTMRAPAVQFTSKARFLASDKIAFCDQPRLLRALYFLGEGDSSRPVFERVNPGAALIELVKHSFLLDTEEEEMLSAHFDELAGLVKRHIFFKLDYPRRYEDLVRVRKAIESHCLEISHQV